MAISIGQNTTMHINGIAYKWNVDNVIIVSLLFCICGSFGG